MPLHLVTGYAGVEHITSADQGSFNIAMMGADAFVLDRGSKFQASIQTNNSVRISDGDALFQGRHIRLKENTFEDVSFDNGTQGMKRHDLIVIRYNKNSLSSVESASFAVIKGTPHQTDPQDPEYTVGDITEAVGDLVADMPLYRVIFDGLTLDSIELLFQTVDTWKDLQEGLQDQVDNAIEAMHGEVDEAIGEIETALSTLPNIVIDNIDPETKKASLPEGAVYIFCPDMP